MRSSSAKSRRDMSLYRPKSFSTFDGNRPGQHLRARQTISTGQSLRLQVIVIVADTSGATGSCQGALPKQGSADGRYTEEDSFLQVANCIRAHPASLASGIPSSPHLQCHVVVVDLKVAGGKWLKRHALCRGRLIPRRSRADEVRLASIVNKEDAIHDERQQLLLVILQQGPKCGLSLDHMSNANAALAICLEQLSSPVAACTVAA